MTYTAPAAATYANPAPTYAAPPVTYAAPPVTYAAPSATYAAPMQSVGSMVAYPQAAPALTPQEFYQVDRNHDGRIDAQEVRAAPTSIRRKLSKKKKKGGCC